MTIALARGLRLQAAGVMKAQDLRGGSVKRRLQTFARWMPVLAVVTIGCGPSDDPTDGGVDGGQDVVEDVTEDVSLPDGGPPDSETDATVDVTSDQQSDVVEDAMLDAPFDGSDAELDAGLDGSADGPPPDAPYPPQCGDGYRDLSEECDDGLGTTPESRACTEACAVADRLVALDPSVQQRWLGSTHSVASGPNGHAVAVIEQLEHPNDLEPRVTVALFDAPGRRLGTSNLVDVDFDVAPAVEALPDGDFALVVSQMDLDAEGLGIGLYRIPETGGEPEFVTVVNESTAYGQHGPAAAWDGSALVVAWLDDSPNLNPAGSGRRVCSQRFTPDLVALSAKESCFDESVLWPSDLALAAATGSTAIAWRESDGYDDHIVVQGEGWRWDSEALVATAAFEPPTLSWLDNGTLLVIATEGDGLQRATVLDGGSELVPFEPLPAPSGLPRYGPTLAATPYGVYLAWSEPEEPPDGGWTATLGEVWLQKLVWTGTELDSSSQPPIPLPRQAAHQVGDQHRPIIVPVVDSTQPAPGGALLACWNDLTADNFLDQSEHGDVVLELIPTPIVRGLVF
jgi:hypothetical protein